MNKIRVAFQGGGAYLAVMLPMAHAFSNTCSPNSKYKVMELDSVSGTSAGSIAAYLLASNCDFEELRNKMKPEIAGIAEKLAAGFYEPPSWWKIVSAMNKIRKGKDIFKRDDLKILISKMQEHGKGSDFLTFEEFRESKEHPNLYAAVSDLHYPYLDFKTDGHALDAVVDSCSIPFAFKGFISARSNTLIDGGICENLPTGCFDQDDDTPVFTVSVHDNNTPNFTDIGLLGYLRALFSTTTSYSVRRSKEPIGQDFILEEIAKFGFHEVKSAVEWYLDDARYREVLERTESRLRGFAKFESAAGYGHRHLSGFSTLKKRDADLKALLGNLYEADNWNVEKSSFLVTAYSADRSLALAGTHTDIMQNFGTLEATIDGPRAYKAFVRLSGDRFHPTSWSVRNVTQGKAVKFRAISYHDQEDGGPNIDPCFIVFEDPEADIKKGDVVEISNTQPAPTGASLAGLIGDAKSDFVSNSNKHLQDIFLEIILRYPSDLGDITPHSRDGDFAAFELLPEDRLDQFRSAAEDGFRVVGVRSVDPVPKGREISVDFSLSN